MRNKLIFSIILFSLILSGCQSLLPATDAGVPVFPTPFQETLEADIIRPSVTATHIPTATKDIIESDSENVQNPTSTETQATTTQIFPQATPSYQHKHPELAQAIDQIITQSGGRWHIVLKEVDGNTFYSLLTEQRINIASVIKVPLALLFFAALEEKGVSEYQLVDHIQSTGTGGRTFEQLLEAMLVDSEEDATEIIANYTNEYLNVPTQLRDWELDIDLKARRYTAAGVASLFERLYQGDFVSPTAQRLILEYLNTYTPNDESRIGILRNVIPESYQIYNKRGSLLTPYVVGDSAIIENPNGTNYILTIFAYNSEPKTTYEVLDQSVGEIALAFWKYISAGE